jgi:hypothetical protein
MKKLSEVDVDLWVKEFCNDAQKIGVYRLYIAGAHATLQPLDEVWVENWFTNIIETAVSLTKLKQESFDESYYKKVSEDLSLKLYQTMLELDSLKRKLNENMRDLEGWKITAEALMTDNVK